MLIIMILAQYYYIPIAKAAIAVKAGLNITLFYYTGSKVYNIPPLSWKNYTIELHYLLSQNSNKHNDMLSTYSYKIKAEIWITPAYDNDWNQLLGSYNLYPDEVHRILKNHLYEALGIISSSTYEKVDYEHHRIILGAIFSFSNTKNYDSEKGIFKIKNSIKAHNPNSGYVEIFVKIYDEELGKIYDIYPDTPYRTSYTVKWIRGVSDSLYYYVYLKQKKILKIENAVPGNNVYLNIKCPDGTEIKKTIEGDAQIPVYLGKGCIIHAESDRYNVTSDISGLLDNPYLDPDSLPDYINIIVLSNVKVIVDASLPGITATINGEDVTLPYTGEFKVGSMLRISVPDSVIIEEGNNQRVILRFIGWSDGDFSTYREFSIKEPVKLTANYKRVTQYYVYVKSEYGEVKGEGWYDEGKTAVVSVSGFTSDHMIYLMGGDMRVKFSGIYVSNGESSESPRISFIVSSPVVVNVKWIKEYRVIIKTYSGKREEWVKEREYIVLPSPDFMRIDSGNSEVLVFSGWRVGEELLKPGSRVIVDRPLEVEAVYEPYILVYIPELNLQRETPKVEGFVLPKYVKDYILYTRYVCGYKGEKGESFVPGMIVREGGIYHAEFCNDYTRGIIFVGVSSVAVLSFYLYKARMREKKTAKREEVEETQVYEVEEDEETRVYDIKE